MRSSLSSLITRMMLLCVIPLLLLAVYIAGARVHEINAESQRRAGQVADSLQVALDGHLSARIAGLQTLADSPLADPLNLPLLYREAQAFEAHFGGRVVLADESLRPLFNTRVPLDDPLPARLPRPAGTAAAPLALASGRPAVGDSFTGNVVNVRLVAIAVPVMHGQQPRKVLINTIETRLIQEFIGSLDLPPGWQLSVIDGSGSLIARLPEGSQPAGGEKRWSSRSGVAPWTVAVDIPALVFYRKQIETAAWTLLLIAGALAASIVLGRLTGRKLYRSMLTLTAADSATGSPPAQIEEIDRVRQELDRERRSRHDAEQAQRASEARWRYAIEGSGDGLWDWDLVSGTVFYSERWKSMLGFGEGDLRGHIDEWGELVHPDDKDQVLAAVDAHLEGRTPEFVQEYRIRCKDGHWKWMLARGKAMPGASGGAVTRMIGTNADITARKEAEAQIEYLAFYDPLTGLANRKLLQDRIHQATAASARSLQHGALLFIDLDGFKSVNDMWGHSIGDQMLLQAAQRMKQQMRAGDTIARLGGDEFVIVVQNLGLDRDGAAHQAAVIADKVLDCYIQPFSMDGHEFQGGASIGITLFRDEPLSSDALLGQADSAMYRAKADGGNACRYFDAGLQASLLEKSAFEADLRQSIARRQLHLVYQPQMDSDGRMVGAEALLRWQHPKLGMVPPARFVPVAEKDNFIVELGRWVMREACRTLAALAREPATRELTVAVNVSARQFLQPEFLAMVEAALRDSGANPRQLKIELTESIFAQDMETIVGKMTRLHELGIGLSLDDFGTGYSCLAYLKQLPFDQIKIDQAFVSALPGEPRDAAIVHTIIALCDSLKVAVIAEGVETEAQRQFLELNGCRMFQGYLFSPPVAADALLDIAGATA